MRSQVLTATLLALSLTGCINNGHNPYGMTGRAPITHSNSAGGIPIREPIYTPPAPPIRYTTKQEVVECQQRVIDSHNETPWQMFSPQMIDAIGGSTQLGLNICASRYQP